MAKKSKEKSLNLYYLENDNKKKKIRSPKNVKKEQVKDDTFCFDDEIIIGVTKLPDEKQTKQNTKKQKNN